MRASCVIFFLATATISQSALASTMSREDAMERVHAAGYPYVSKSEEKPGAWDVWASKDGIVYRVEIDASSGTVIAATPIASDD